VSSWTPPSAPRGDEHGSHPQALLWTGCPQEVRRGLPDDPQGGRQPQGGNIKLGSVASDTLGKSGREMLEALVASSTDAKAMTPGNNESAGKRMSGKTRKGSPHLRSLLIEAALAVSRTNDNYLAGQYHQVAKRRGKKKAAVAVGHSILVIIYHLLTRKEDYHDTTMTLDQPISTSGAVREPSAEPWPSLTRLASRQPSRPSNRPHKQPISRTTRLFQSRGDLTPRPPSRRGKGEERRLPPSPAGRRCPTGAKGARGVRLLL